MSTPNVLVHRSADLLAQSTAARLVTGLVDLQSSGKVPHLVLTGGTIADRIHAAVAASAARDAVDWSRLHVWWGDERFLPDGDDDRNETQARKALLDQVHLDPDRIHAIAPSDQVPDVDAAAEAYAESLRSFAAPEDHGPTPTFDILMLGVGPDGHVASLFPERPALYDERAVVGVRNSPKPPSHRVSLTLAALQRAHEVWFVVSGSDKAKAVHLALGGGGPYQVPAAGVRGLNRTLWMLDSDAARQLPSDWSRA